MVTDREQLIEPPKVWQGLLTSRSPRPRRRTGDDGDADRANRTSTIRTKHAVLGFPEDRYVAYLIDLG